MARKFHRIRQATMLSAASVALLAGSTAAFAQGANQTAQAKDVEEVVVTGTLIRGITPVGANVVGISREEIQNSGAIDANALLGNLPQSTFFLELPEPGGGAGAAGILRIPTIQPNIRRLPLGGTPTGQPTLVLLDNHRIVPVGIEQSTVEANIIPPGMLDRQDALLDGASAIYGTDAVGGVLNYIPRKRFNETSGNVQYGFADEYYTISANAMSGKTWDGGGIGLAYSFAKNDNLLDRDRAYALPKNYFENKRPTGLACPDHTHITTGSTAAGTFRRFVVYGNGAFAERTDWCDLGYGTMVSAQERNAGFLTFSQDISDTLKLDLTAFYSHQLRTTNGGPYAGTATLTSTHPYYRAITGITPAVSATVTQNATFSYADVLGFESAPTYQTSEVGQVTPTITWDVGGGWQVKGDMVYGKSKLSLDSKQRDTDIEAINKAGTTRRTAINPYDPALTENLLLIGQIDDYHNRKDGKHTFAQAIVKADGPLFAISGGEVKAAFGAEWNKTDFSKRITNADNHILQPYTDASVNDKALFGEVNIPIVGPDNRMTGVESLTLNLSGRWDTYAFYGDTFNPKIAATYEPVDWIALRGNWGKAFRAPNAADRMGGLYPEVRCIGGSGNLPPCTSATALGTPPFAQGGPGGLFFTGPPGTTSTGAGTIFTASPNVYLNAGGTRPGVRPEKAKTWSIGADIRPPIVPGLTISGSYYQINFRDHLNIPNPQITLTSMFNFAPELIIPCFTPTTITGCTDAQIDAWASQFPNGPDVVRSVRASGYRIVELIDTRVLNLFKFNVAGADASVRYVHRTSWGSISGNVNANWNLKSKSQLFATSPISDNLAFGASKFRMTLGMGVTYGDFTANANLQHQAGYTPTASTTRVPDQLTIDQFDVLNMNFRYNVNGALPLTQDLTLSLVVNNVLDTEPPVSKTTTGGTANGSTLGRFIQFGVSKKF